MGDPAQARLDAADHDREAGEGPARQLRVDGDRVVRAQAGAPPLAVLVLVAPVAGGRVVGEHGVEVARGHADEEPGPSHRQERVGRAPVRLRDDADPQPLGLEDAADQRRAERGVVDVGVAGDDQHVDAVPPARRGLGGGRRQRRRRRRPLSHGTHVAADYPARGRARSTARARPSARAGVVNRRCP